MTSQIDTRVIDSALSAVATRLSDLDLAGDASLKDALHSFETIRARQSAPLTLAIAGLDGAGKSSLVNLLAGQSILPVGEEGRGALPILLDYGTETETGACWLDGEMNLLPGHVVDAATAQQPDYIKLAIDIPALAGLRLLDMGALDDPEQMWQAVDLLEETADILLWCSPATDPLQEEEMQVLEALPPALVRDGFLVLTKADQIRQLETVRTRMGAGKARFASTIPVATRLALQGGQDPNIWGASGAERLVDAVLGRAHKLRLDRLATDKTGLLTCLSILAPALKAKSTEKAVADTVLAQAPSTPPDAPALSAPVSQPSLAPSAAGAQAEEDPLVSAWRQRFDTLRRKLDGGGFASNEEFVTAVQIMVEDFLQQLAEPNLLPLRADWLFDEFERANDLLILLQFEGTQGVAADAARVLLQLDDAIRQAAATRHDAADSPADPRAAVS